MKWTTEADYTATRAQLEEIYDYVPRGDPEEVARERTVTLARDHPRRGENGAIGSPRANPKKTPGRKSLPWTTTRSSTPARRRWTVA